MVPHTRHGSPGPAEQVERVSRSAGCGRSPGHGSRAMERERGGPTASATPLADVAAGPLRGDAGEERRLAAPDQPGAGDARPGAAAGCRAAPCSGWTFAEAGSRIGVVAHRVGSEPLGAPRPSRRRRAGRRSSPRAGRRRRRRRRGRRPAPAAGWRRRRPAAGRPRVCPPSPSYQRQPPMSPRCTCSQGLARSPRAARGTEKRRNRFLPYASARVSLRPSSAAAPSAKRPCGLEARTHPPAQPRGRSGGRRRARRDPLAPCDPMWASVGPPSKASVEGDVREPAPP